jgi:hypothetical protein
MYRYGMTIKRECASVMLSGAAGPAGRATDE